MFDLVRIIHDQFLRLEEWQKRGSDKPTFVIRTSDSCSGLLYHRVRDCVLLVRQNRAPMIREDNPNGEIVDLPAGRFDRAVGPKALFVAEAKEEAGANLTEDDVELLNDGRPLAVSPGVLTERCYLAFVEIREEHLDEGEVFGLAEEHEVTTRVWTSVDDFLRGPHEDLRVYTLARELESRRSRER